MKKPLPSGAVGRARALRQRPTDAEKRLWWALREQLPHIHFRRQVPIGPYFADFCCHAARLVVEVDGGQHTPEIDAARTALIGSEGYRVIRFWNHEVLAQTGDVIATIWRELIDFHPHLTSPIKGEGPVTAIQEGRPLPFDGEGQGGVTPPGHEAPTP